MSNWYDKYVPDEGPDNARILFVGEAPGETEHEQGRPFIGTSGNLLCDCLARNGVRREEVYLANLCHYRPDNNKFEKLLNSDILRKGLVEIGETIRRIQPTVIVPLGKYPLLYLTGKQGIKKWRGSILSYIADEKIKCIPTYHPAAVTRDRKLYPIFNTDIQRILGDAEFPERRLPERKFILNPTGLDLEECVQLLCEADTLAVDIETVKRSTHILCVGFAPRKDLGICFVPTTLQGRDAIQKVLLSSAKKIFQNGSFDLTQLRLNHYLFSDPYAAKLDREYYWDTQIAQHVMNPELPKSLEFLTSIFTREPYYKTVGRGSIPEDAKGWDIKVDKQSLYEYNARDCCCTFEVYEHQRRLMLKSMSNGKLANLDWVSTFDFEMGFLEVLHHMSDAGMPIDIERRDMLINALMAQWVKKQHALNSAAKGDCNVRSPRLTSFLYDKDKLGLPVRRKRDGRITADEDAIVSLISFCKTKMNEVKKAETKMEWQIRLMVCQLILEVRGIRQNLSVYLRDTPKNPRLRLDGRIHSTYKWGPETGRLAASKYVDGSGFNAQTLPRDPIEVPDSWLTKPEEVVILERELENEPDEDAEEDQEEAA